MTSFELADQLADQLAGPVIEKVVLESTSDYSWPFYYLHVMLVNARDVKNAPGRPRSDRLDAVWLARLAALGNAAALVRAAAGDPAAAGLHPAVHRPDPERTGHRQRLEKLLEDARRSSWPEGRR